MAEEKINSISLTGSPYAQVTLVEPQVWTFEVMPFETSSGFGICEENNDSTLEPDSNQIGNTKFSQLDVRTALVSTAGRENLDDATRQAFRHIKDLPVVTVAAGPKAKHPYKLGFPAFEYGSILKGINPVLRISRNLRDSGLPKIDVYTRMIQEEENPWLLEAPYDFFPRTANTASTQCRCCLKGNLRTIRSCETLFICADCKAIQSDLTYCNRLYQRIDAWSALEHPGILLLYHQLDLFCLLSEAHRQIIVLQGHLRNFLKRFVDDTGTLSFETLLRHFDTLWSPGPSEKLDMETISCALALLAHYFSFHVGASQVLPVLLKESVMKLSSQIHANTERQKRLDMAYVRVGTLLDKDHVHSELSLAMSIAGYLYHEPQEKELVEKVRGLLKCPARYPNAETSSDVEKSQRLVSILEEKRAMKM